MSKNNLDIGMLKGEIRIVSDGTEDGIDVSISSTNAYKQLFEHYDLDKEYMDKKLREIQDLFNDIAEHMCNKMDKDEEIILED